MFNNTGRALYKSWLCFSRRIHVYYTLSSIKPKNLILSPPQNICLPANNIVFSAKNQQISVALKFKMSDKKAFERLPSTVTPVNYAVTLKPNIPNFTFEGSEDITVKVSLTLNSN